VVDRRSVGICVRVITKVRADIRRSKLRLHPVKAAHQKCCLYGTMMTRTKTRVKDRTSAMGRAGRLRQDKDAGGIAAVCSNISDKPIYGAGNVPGAGRPRIVRSKPVIHHCCCEAPARKGCTDVRVPRFVASGKATAGNIDQYRRPLLPRRVEVKCLPRTGVISEVNQLA
jgi:hypothetical protein